MCGTTLLDGDRWQLTDEYDFAATGCKRIFLALVFSAWAVPLLAQSNLS
jgi:hypothetical protein